MVNIGAIANMALVMNKYIFHEYYYAIIIAVFYAIKININ
jgi:hypothetical protein